MTMKRNLPEEYNIIPGEILDSFEEYIQFGTAPGHFVRGCLENNLHDAFARADSSNVAILGKIVTYMYNRIPSECWGSKAKVEAWIKKGGCKNWESYLREV